jgi:hypothetical protein
MSASENSSHAPPSTPGNRGYIMLTDPDACQERVVCHVDRNPHEENTGTRGTQRLPEAAPANTTPCT